MKTEIDYASRFSANLRELMASHNLNQRDICRALNITPSLVSNYVNGQRLPGSINLLKLSWFFSVSMEYLLTGED